MKNTTTPIQKNERSESSDALLITRAQAAERYNFCLKSIDNLIAQGIIPAVRFSKKCVRIPIKDADESLMKFKIGGAS